ncbi:dynein heavy chain 2, axonemal, partial [Caerostris darwini]
MAKDQLSKQKHCEFGLKAIINFLKCMGKQKRLNPKWSDLEIIITTLRSTALPKLDSSDARIFESILETALGTVKMAAPEIPTFVEEIKKTLKTKSFQPETTIVKKISELDEIKKYFHASILVGESGSGKTTSWKTLKETYNQLHETNEAEYPSVNTYSFNPKAYTLSELFGYFTDTGLWVDGLFSVILKEACNDLRTNERWIILNGPIDTSWIGTISSLLDNNKVLSTANGERIMLSSEVYLIFETTNLINCSPNIVSHCGIIYHESSTVDMKMYLNSWLQNEELDNIRDDLKEFFDKYLSSVLNYCDKNLKSSPSLTLLNRISSFIGVLNSFLKKISKDKIPSSKLKRIFWMSVTWSIGAVFDEPDRHLFDSLVKSLDESLEEVTFIYDYNLDGYFEWAKWDSYLAETWKSDPGITFENLMVPTVASVSYQTIIELLLKEMKPVLLIGKSGCGKTIIAEDLLHKLKEEYLNYNVNFSPQISSMLLQQMLEKQLEKKAGGLLLPPSGQRMIVFLDDFDFGESDEFECHSSLELLYMAVDGAYFYNRQKWKLNILQNLCFIASASSPSEYHNKIPEPLFNRFNVINILPPQEPQMKRIFISLLKEIFPETNIEIRRSINAVSLGSMAVYNKIKDKFLPVPSKLHYLFGIKDVKRVLCEFLEVHTDLLNDKVALTKFWFHECFREFTDRLTSGEEKEEFFQIIEEVIEKEFLIQLKDHYPSDRSLKNLHYLRIEKTYEEVKDIAIPRNYFENCIEEYKKAHDIISHPILLFEYNINHLCRILRGIYGSSGNMLLLGANGTGKSSLSRIAAHLLKYEVFEIKRDQTYDIAGFKRDLHKLLYDTGVNKKMILFLLNEDDIVDDMFLHYLSDILTIGVPFDVFTPEELRMIYSELSPESDGGHKILIKNIQCNLHIIFCFNYISPLYKKCFLKYPALYKRCSLDWFDEWPYEALQFTAHKFLKDIDLKPTNEQRLDVCCNILAYMQINALKYSKNEANIHGICFETSSTFVKLVTTFKRVLTNKQTKVEEVLRKLTAGLDKIRETQEKFIQEKKVEIEKKEKVCKRIAIAAEEDLNAAMPALDEARKALEALNKRDIGEIKSYAKPPIIVEIVLEAVMILRNSEPSWAEAKRQLGSATFLKELYTYDRDNITDAALNKIGKYIKKPEFQPQTVGKVSVAAKSLCMWVRAMYAYGNIYKKVKPKMERLRIANEELERLQRRLNELIKELEELQASIIRLEEEHRRLIEKKEELARKARELALKLQRAESIIEGLSSEKERWEKKVQSLFEKRILDVGDSFLVSGYLTYLGPHDQSHRSFLRKQWKSKINDKVFPCTPKFDLARFFVEKEVLNEWRMDGLPNDQYSNEGAAIVTESCFSPFIVDPEGQAVKWIKNMEAKRKIRIFDFQDPKWTLAVEMAIVQGFPILLLNVNPELESHLAALLKQPLDHPIIKFNHKRLKIDPSFKLYMLTKMINPLFTYNTTHLTCIVNFTIKEKGLEDQLLPLIVLHERSDLENRKEKLVHSIRDCKKQLSEIEDTVLRLLSASTGSLLDDEVLVEALQKSKTAALEIEEKLSSNEKTEAIIDSARDKYRPCAKLAAILYFVLTDMASVDSMYVFTLDAYIALFLHSINMSPRDPEAVRRITKLNTYHQIAVYRYACRTIFEKHALLLAFHICTRIMLLEGKLEKAEHDFFIKGGQVIDRSNQPPNPCSQWLSQESWDNITQLERLPRFLSITVSFDENSRLWEDWYLTLEPEKRPLPGIWRNVCSGFHMLLLIRCLRLDRLTSCMAQLISDTIGNSFLEYPKFAINEIFRDSTPNKPLVLFTASRDTNPEKIIQKLAVNLEVRFRAISLGKGQENAASQLIIDSAKMGYWVFISKCHLLLHWLPALEKFVSKLQAIKVHEKFRLWLGSAPEKHFPTSILQNSIIVTLDSPKSIRGHMLTLYDEFITEGDIKTSTCELKYKSLLFSMAFFHSVLVERKRFQNLGWNFNYSFRKEDFKVSSMLLKLYLEEYKDTPWAALRSLIAETTYGGHIADKNDERLMMTYYDQYFCDEVCANVKHRLSTVSEFSVPEDGPLETYVTFIAELPIAEAPEVFGQHSNAVVPHLIEDGKDVLSDLKRIKGESFADASSDVQVSKVITDLKLRIPDLIDEMAALDILNEKPDPYNEILVQETRRYNILLNLVMQSLKELEAGILGKILMTEKLEEFSEMIMKMEVPAQWQKLYPTLKPLGSWINDLRLRVEQFTKWISKGVMPVKLWLPGFSAPRSVLNATLQTTIKNSDVMLNELIWEYHVSALDESHITEPPAEGIYIRGLLLEGAGWDKTNSILAEAEPLYLITPMPVILFKPVTESSVR